MHSLRPELAVADRFDDAAERQVVVGHGGFGRLHAGPRAGRVIVRQQHDMKVRAVAGLFSGLQLVDELGGAVDVGDDEREADGGGAHVLFDRLDAGWRGHRSGWCR